MPKYPPWTTTELSISVEGYLDMFEDEHAGRHVNKAATFRALSAGPLSRRTKKSVEHRFQNISSILAHMGLPFIEGLKPKSHVGVTVAGVLERSIASSLERRVQASRSPWLEIVAEVVGPRVGGPVAEGEASAVASDPPPGRRRPWTIRLGTTRYARDPKVVEWVRERAGGQCESCAEPAPFSAVASNGRTYPFLEVHHVRHLADGGADTVTNAVALCPNCHRELHFGAEAGLKREALYRRMPCLVRDD